ncbi:MAG: hypothetical protein ACJASZ_002025 [Yoonia sp.]|jgi:hypothetical protein
MKYFYALITLILTLTFVLSPALTSPFSGFSADQLPIPQINPPVQPAGYAFAIWGLIYGWLVVSAGFGIWKRGSDLGWDRARLPLIVSLGVGTPWLAVANNSAIWATIMIFVMAIGAILALIRAPKKDDWLFKVPVGIYAGWLTAASFVSLGSTAAGYGILTDQMGWAYLGIIGALATATVVMLRTAAPSYGLTVIWALVAIIVASQLENGAVSALATAGIAIIIALITLSRPNARLHPF